MNAEIKPALEGLIAAMEIATADQQEAEHNAKGGPR